MHEPIDYFEHGADIGIVGRGTLIEEAFENAARAMFAIMADLGQVEQHESVDIEFEEADTELALVTWLNLLLGQARSRALIFGRFHLRRDRASPKAEDRRSGPPKEVVGDRRSGPAEEVTQNRRPEASEEVGTFPTIGVETGGARWRGTAEGEPWRAGLERGVEVKGATLTGLAVTERDGIWEARCVVDV